MRGLKGSMRLRGVRTWLRDQGLKVCKTMLVSM